MSSSDPSLPEGTDKIIAGAGESGDGPRPDPRAMFFDKIEELRGQAGDSARDFAQSGKDSLTAALDDVVRMVEQAAGQIDARLGTNYGDYARRTAQGIGDFSETVKGRDVDDLFAEARALVQKSPAVAVGAAAALGFLVARLIRTGLDETGPAGRGKDGGKA